MRDSTTAAGRWMTIPALWLALAIVFMPQALILNYSRPDPQPWWMAALGNLQIFMLWALFTPAVLWLLRRFPPTGPRRRLHLALHAASAFGCIVLHLLAMGASAILVSDQPIPVGHLFGALAVGLAATDVLMYGAVFAAGVALQQRAVRRDAERRLVEARLEALRAQLQPHFLFNTLNALSELVHRDADAAEALLLKLSALLRRALDDGAARTIALGEELDFLEDYLAIQQMLLGPRLRIVRRIAPDTLGWPVPPLLLQPLVENAIRHGIAPRRAGGTLTLEAIVTNDVLELLIVDDGTGVGVPDGSGVGLRNTRERLQALYGERASLRLDRPADGGWRVRLSLPREAYA